MTFAYLQLEYILSQIKYIFLNNYNKICKFGPQKAYLCFRQQFLFEVYRKAISYIVYKPLT